MSITHLKGCYVRHSANTVDWRKKKLHNTRGHNFTTKLRKQIEAEICRDVSSNRHVHSNPRVLVKLRTEVQQQVLQRKLHVKLTYSILPHLYLALLYLPFKHLICWSKKLHYTSGKTHGKCDMTLTCLSWLYVTTHDEEHLFFAMIYFFMEVLKNVYKCV